MNLFEKVITIVFVVWCFGMVVFISVSCSSPTMPVAEEPADYTLNCTYVGQMFQRCENNEVICYTSHVYEGDSLSCFEKKAK